ncbi:MAG: hypothetical protein A3F16_05275 [Deltaproteobacteria bacterium RIFCSPHIGHO2_12_FULL_43_9]|nr:MAG: hypothetical protein A3F16_05275 [Deltaproteobacteria bacterium RIFCSPHIGHO2_12_FULL_43_9]
MTFKISTLNLRRKLGELLNRVALRHDQFVIERKGELLAAMVPVVLLKQIQLAAKMHLLDILSDKNINLTNDEIEIIANEAKHKSREPKSSLGKKGK